MLPYQSRFELKDARPLTGSVSVPLVGRARPNFSARFLFFSSSIAIFSFISLHRERQRAPLVLGRETYGVISTSGLAAGALGAAGAVVGAGAAFFSGNPNLAARFANTSSDKPNGALSIAPAFGAAVLGSVAAAVVGLEVPAGSGFVGRLALGLNGIPNRSARAFIACCSGVRSMVSPLDSAEAGAAGAEAGAAGLAVAEAEVVAGAGASSIST